MNMLPDFWKHDYWLPHGVTWEDMEKLPAAERPQPRDLLVALPVALGFVTLRHVFERFLVPPLARCLGVKNRSQVAAAPSPQLESFYSHKSKHPTQDDIANLVQMSSKTQREVETWFRRRRNQDRPCQTKKFGEATWRFLFYLSAFIAGLSSLINKSWMWDQRECWSGYPLQPLERVHFWYYMLELGFYVCLLLRISVDIKRKDFKEQVIHHVVTIILISFSYCANFIRIGTLVLLLHDTSDILLESGKMFHYGTGWKKLCDRMFVVFTVVFLVTRLVIFPSKIIYATLVLSIEDFPPFVGYYFFNIMLMVLQVLHIFWAGLILRMVYKFLNGKLEKDERSDDESETGYDSEDEKLNEKGDFHQGKSKETFNSKLSALSNSCVLNNLAHHRSSLGNKHK